MRIVKQSERGVTVSYALEFGIEVNGRLALRYGFDCDEKGNVFPLKYQAARDNLARCQAGVDGIKSMGIVKRSHDWYSPAIGECIQCKRHVTLSGFTNTCECGVDYNSGGQALAPRSQWGEETGESLDEILSIK